MKRLIRAASEDLIMADPYFSLVWTEGKSIYGYPWKGLKVISKGPAKKHVVEVSLEPTNKMTDDFDGDVFEYEYGDVYVNHGNRMEMDTLEETEEYAEVLQDAVAFARKIKKYFHM